MQVLRTLPHKIYDCDEVIEIFDSNFCARVNWTREDNYIPYGEEKVFVLEDSEQVGVGWRVREGHVISPETEVLEDIKIDKILELSEERWKEEVGGTEFKGVKVHTDRESQTKYIGAVLAYQITKQFPSKWKGLDGWIELNSSNDLIDLSTTVSNHVNTCFAKEEMLTNQVNEADSVELVQNIKW
jgi:hypothetical protein